MSNSIYIISALIILTLSTWLDSPLTAFGIRKSAFLPVLCVSVFLAPVTLNIYDTEISPLSVLLPAASFIFAVMSRQYSFFYATATELILAIFGCALLYLFPESSSSVIIPLLSVISGLLLYSRPLLALNVSLTFPYIIYMVSLFADFFFFMGNNSPDHKETLFAQVSGAAICFFTLYLMHVAIKKRSRA